MAGQYQFGKQKQLDELTDKILNREKFSYDLNGDAFYNQYKDKFTQQGKMAMMDTMGQAAALTGGYGSSYAQQVGQQAYQGYLQGLNDKVPELYQLALDNYDRQGDALLQQYGILADQDAQDYSRHRDAVADAQWQAEFDEAKRQYEERMALSRGAHTSPDGNDNPEAASQTGKTLGGALAQIFNGNGKKNGANQVGGTIGDVAADAAGRHTKSSDGLTAGTIKMLQRVVGADETGVWSDDNIRASGGRSAQEAFDAYQRGQLQFYNPGSPGFTGTTYADAVKYMKTVGVANQQATAALTEKEWNTQRAAYKKTGEGMAEVTDYSTYADYLKAYVAYAISTMPHNEDVDLRRFFPDLSWIRAHGVREGGSGGSF